MTRTKLHVKKDDLVKIITGDSKGVEGKILSVNRLNQTVIVEGAKAAKKAVKPTQENSTGGWVDKVRAIHISNVTLVTEKSEKAPVSKKAAKKAARKSSAKKTAK